MLAVEYSMDKGSGTTEKRGRSVTEQEQTKSFSLLHALELQLFVHAARLQSPRNVIGEP
jgi:hypothetical protein